MAGMRPRSGRHEEILLPLLKWLEESSISVSLVLMAKGNAFWQMGFLVESPTWSPNGRVIMFFREIPKGKLGDKETKIYSIDLTGQNEREIVTPMEASDPAWSPLIP